MQLIPGQLLLTVHLIMDTADGKLTHAEPVHVIIEPHGATRENLDVIVHNVSNMAWQFIFDDPEDVERFLYLSNHHGDRYRTWPAPENGQSESEIARYIWSIIGE